MNKGFTFIEVLVAMLIISITVVTVFNFLDRSFANINYTSSKQQLIDKGYERVLMNMHYPEIHQPDNEKVNGTEITYIVTSRATPVIGVKSLVLKVESNKATVRYEYFEKSE